MHRIAPLTLALAATLAFPLVALAHGDGPFDHRPSEHAFEDDPDANPLLDSEHFWSAHAGIGFGLDPDGFATGFGLERHITHAFSVGPRLQLSVPDDDRVLLAVTANARYHWSFAHLDDPFLNRLEPFVQGGLGFVHADRDDPEADDTDFLINGGFGLDVRLNERVSLGTTLMFHGVPGDDEVLGEEFFFTWELIGARFHF